MIIEDTVVRALDAVLPRRLAELQESTGLPVVFGGTTRSVHDGQQLTINQLIGTFGESLRLLSVIPGRGLGGAAMERRVPCRVSDYASTPGITHDYDHAVERERLKSILAFPIQIHGTLRGVIYGALRENQPIGDVAVRNAGVVATHIARDVESILERHSRTPTPLVLPSSTAAGHGAVVDLAALEDLAALARDTADPVMRERLGRIHRRLRGEPSSEEKHPHHSAEGPLLAPREIESLRLVAGGATNSEIAGELGITVSTVKAYLHSAMRKLDVRNRAKAVLAAQTSGLL